MTSLLPSRLWTRCDAPFISIPFRSAVTCSFSHVSPVHVLLGLQGGVFFSFHFVFYLFKKYSGFTMLCQFLLYAVTRAHKYTHSLSFFFAFFVLFCF